MVHRWICMHRDWCAASYILSEFGSNYPLRHGSKLIVGKTEQGEDLLTWTSYHYFNINLLNQMQNVHDLLT